MRSFIIGFIIFSIPLNCLAVCEHERAERDYFRNLVNGASTGSNVLAIAGGGPHEWWNLHPASNPTQHQAGIHRANAPAREIFQ